MRTPTSHSWLILRCIRLITALTRALTRLFRSFVLLVLCFSAALLLNDSLLTVNAVEDEEIIVVSDPGTWAAFKYFQDYGFQSSFENTETQTLSTSGSSTISGEFTFSGQFSGSFAANINLSYTGSIGDSGLGVASIISTENVHIGSAANPSQTIEMTIHPEGYQTDQNNGFAFACTYNAQSTSTSAVMNCSPTSGAAETVILPDQTITVDTLEVYGGVQGTYLVKMLNEGTETGTLAGSLSGSIGGGGQVTLSESYSETTTTQNKTKFSFTMPYMKHSTGSLSPLSYTVNKRIIGSKDDPFVCYYMTHNRNIYSALTLKELNSNDNIPNSDGRYVRKELWGSYGGLQLAGFEYFGSGAWVNYGLPNSGNPFTFNDILYPLYVGKKSQMSDELYRFIYGSDRTVEKIDEQIAADQQHHDEMMDTSDSAKIQTDGDELVEDANEKFGDLFFPLNHAIETANDLANVDATGVIRLPAIFSNNEYWYLDLTQIEQKLPDAWAFIQALCQLAVAIYLIHGLYSLFFGGKEDDS